MMRVVLAFDAGFLAEIAFRTGAAPALFGSLLLLMALAVSFSREAWRP